MNAKEVLVQALRDEGYDFITTCEIVSKWLPGLEPGTHNVIVGSSTLRIEVTA